MLEWISFMSGVVSAILWGISATRPVPEIRNNIDMLSVDLQYAVAALRSQSRWNAWAALASAVTILLQAAAHVLNAGAGFF